MQAQLRQDSPPAGARVRRIDALLREGRYAEADTLCRALTDDQPDLPEGWMLTARLRQKQADFPAMLDAARKAARLEPGKTLPRFILIEALFHAGEVAEARKELSALEDSARDDPAVWLRLAAIHTHCGQHADAARCAGKGLELKEQDDEAEQALAASLIALGRFEEAEKRLDAILARNPAAFDAWYNRATIRRQTKDDLDSGALVRALEASRARPGAETPVRYALGKTFEDTGDYARAFDHFAKGAAARRRLMSYRVETDIAAMDEIARIFDAEWAAKDEAGFEEAAPVFVMGLPRSGTTLTERILSAHPEVASVGEVQDMALTVTRAGGPAADRTALIKKVASADPRQIGREYWRAIEGYGAGGAMVIDKTPLNFLYLGVIAKALPNAKIVHLRRHPMASGYAMFKTLFRMGYPFSYDLADIGRYYAAYRRLMDHWRAVFPDRFIDVDYESLVDDAETVSRTIVDHCGLDWDPACLDFHRSAAPSATASAAQVRQPVYRHARDLWREYKTRLQPLAETLRREGVRL